MMMNRRVFSTALVTGAAASLISARGLAANSTPAKASNVVLVHGLFADGWTWSGVIPRLQAAGLNVTSVQNRGTTLPEAVDSALRVLARQDGPTVLAGHSFAGMIVTDAGVHPNVSAVVYVAARAPDAGEDYTALARKFPAPPASAGIVFDGDEGRLSEEAFLHDFAGDLPEAKTKVPASLRRKVYTSPSGHILFVFHDVGTELPALSNGLFSSNKGEQTCSYSVQLFGSKEQQQEGNS